jgi:hypothetical protein
MVELVSSSNAEFTIRFLQVNQKRQSGKNKNGTLSCNVLWQSMALFSSKCERKPIVVMRRARCYCSLVALHSKIKLPLIIHLTVRAAPRNLDCNSF